jgi:hypothetical protein
MRRTPLTRKTPLRAGLKAGLRRSALKPGRPKAYRRDPADRTDSDERAHVLRREGDCIGRVLATMGWVPPHTCRGPFGDPEPHPVPRDHLTAEHVKPAPRMGLRANSSKSAEAKRGDPQRRWMVAACHWANVNGWTSKYRTYVLVYLERLERLGRL